MLTSGARTNAYGAPRDFHDEVLQLIESETGSAFKKCDRLGIVTELNHLCQDQFNPNNVFMVARYGNTPYVGDNQHWQCIPSVRRH